MEKISIKSLVFGDNEANICKTAEGMAVTYRVKSMLEINYTAKILANTIEREYNLKMYDPVNGMPGHTIYLSEGTDSNDLFFQLYAKLW